MSEIIVSLTTTSERINKVHLTILSLLNQNCPLKYSIHLYISKLPYLIDKGINKIPDTLKRLYDDPKFKIFYTENIGSYRKLLPVLKKKWGKDCVIITTDDDKIYKKNFVQSLMKAYFKYDKKYIIAHRAFVRSNDYLNKFFDIDKNLENIIKSISPHDKKKAQTISYKFSPKYDIIRKLSFFEGNDGVLYHTSFFPELVFNQEAINKIAHNHDDFWFKLCTLLKDRSVICISPFHQRITRPIHSTHKNGLHNNFNQGSYVQDLLDMSKWFFS